MTNWQPIETAPKDGTKVLLWVPYLDDIFAAGFEHGQWQTGIWTAKPKLPTHWQPLPEPPEET